MAYLLAQFVDRQVVAGEIMDKGESLSPILYLSEVSLRFGFNCRNVNCGKLNRGCEHELTDVVEREHWKDL